jgi:hypothetical protein
MLKPKKRLLRVINGAFLEQPVEQILRALS